MREAGKQAARCWAHMTDTCSTKTANYCRTQQARSSEHFLLDPQKWRVLHVQRSQPQHETNTFGLYPDSRLVRCVNVHRPPLESLESITTSYTRKSASYAGPHQAGGRGTVPRKLRRRPTSGGCWLTRTFNARLQTRWLPHYHQSPVAPASVTTPPTWPTSSFPLRPN